MEPAVFGSLLLVVVLAGAAFVKLSIVILNEKRRFFLFQSFNLVFIGDKYQNLQ
jgi:hypothetical protein